MPQLVKKRRSGWAVLAAGALVASLLAVGAGPAVALDEDSKVNSPAATFACVGVAAEDMMFSDVSEGHYFRDAINCLAYYGVTIGFGDGTFKPNDDVARADMVRFMERAAGVAGADAEAVVGDFAETGSDPVHRGDMALLIARLLAEANDNVSNNDDGTFAVKGVDGDDWDYFADSRRSQNRVHDSAASALYELGVAKGTGMGYFSPASTVNRGAMAAFITRALAHTTARPAGVTIQSDKAGEVIVSVRDANFHPVPNAAVDVFTAPANRVDEAFNEDGSCNKPRLTAVGSDTAKVCEIDALDAGTGLSGDYETAVMVNVKAGGTTVWAWTGDRGDKVEDGGEGLASINLTKTPPVEAKNAKVTNDLGKGVTRAHFGSTVTVTIQLVGDAAANRADAGPADGGARYTVITRRIIEPDVATSLAVPTVDDTTATIKTTRVLKVDPSGKVTFPITASDPDATDRNNPPGDSNASPAVPHKTDRVHVAYEVTPAIGGLALATDIDGSSGTGTITFSDERGGFVGASVKPTATFLTRPMSGSASNVVTVTAVDQFGDPVRNHLVRLSSTHAPAGSSTFPVARRTDSSGSVRIGYTYMGAGSTETITVNTASDATDDATLTPIDGATAMFYWVAPAAASTDETAAVASGAVLAVDLERNTIVVANSDGPQLVIYDDNDQYTVGASGAQALRSMAAFEEALAADAEEDSTDDTVEVTSYDPGDADDVARFVLTVVKPS